MLGGNGVPTPSTDLQGYCERNYDQLMPIMVEKYRQKQKQKLDEVKANLFEETSQQSESRTPRQKKDLRSKIEARRQRSTSASLSSRRHRKRSPRGRSPERKDVFRRLEKGVFYRLEGESKERSMSANSQHSRDQSYRDDQQKEDSRHKSFCSRDSGRYHSRGTPPRYKDDIEVRGHRRRRSRSRRQRSEVEDDDLAQPWSCRDSDSDPFTPRIRHFKMPKRTRMPTQVKTYDGSEDPEDHLKIFQSAAKVAQWAMPVWCHMFNSTLTGSTRVWFDDLPPETIDSYDELREAFLAKFLQQKKCIKDPVELHNIKQGEGESTEDFMERFKKECRHVKGAPEVLKISGFMHGIKKPELIKRLHDNIPRTVDEMMKATMSFLKGEVAAGNQERRKPSSSWGQSDGGQKHNFQRGGFKSPQSPERKQDRFTLLSKTPREILALEKEKFKPPPPMTTLVEKRNLSKFCDFHGEPGHSTDECIHLRRQIEELIRNGKLLNVRIGDEEHTTSAMMTFFVVRSHSPYNGIIGRPKVRKIQAVPSTAHTMLKFPVDGGVLTLRSSKSIPLECALVSEPTKETPAADPPTEERIKIAIHPEHPEQTVAIGSTLTEEGRTRLCGLLRKYLDVFAWCPADMIGVPRNIAEHRLNIREGYPPVRQKKRGQAPERNKVIREEVEKLVEAGIMKEVHYHSWLVNPVMVKKHDDSWRIMSTRLLSASRDRLESRIPLRIPLQMAEEDEEKTAFITNEGICCYSKMPFELKNVGATYQRLVDKTFYKQIGRNLEVYMDDLVIKNHTEDDILRDMEETFRTLKNINMKLNPKKCTFGVEEGALLGNTISTKDIRACPDKTEAVTNLPSPKCLKEVQKLNGKLASLNRFLSKSAEKSLPFFKTLKKCTKKSDFHWTKEAEEAFQQMKKVIADLLTLTAPIEGEELIIYLAAAKEAVAGRLQKWSIKLGGYDIQYRLRVSVKGQILEDFIVERPEDDSTSEPMEEEKLPKPWTLFTDGSSCGDGSGVGLVLTDPEGT
ncbi:reverse transcriptase domain-containing protein [Artemisia annua]|uniref:Reverse transcriptase domain-containing protein n=1 Tax=Artemisia annua TaxID=35608 RepID=A0A2U1P822_ARTAN|nr:reverse transcriptase domain-containing protein [Artemisia annua]